jgi:hypothetical protein
VTALAAGATASLMIGAMPWSSETLTEVMDTLYATDVDQIPVVENDVSRKFIGVITRRDIIGAYNREVLKKKMLSAKFVTREKEREGIDYVEMPAGYRISKVPVPPGAAGKSLGEVNFRSRYRLQVVELVRTEEGGRSRRLIADPDLSLMPGDALIVIGTEEDLTNYQNQVKG